MLTLKLVVRFMKKSLFKQILVFIAVGFGAAIFYFVLNLASGLEDAVLSVTAEADSHITVSFERAYNGLEGENKEIRDDIMALDTHIHSVAYYLELPINLDITTQVTNTYVLRGIDFLNEGRNINRMYERVTMYDFNQFPKDQENDETIEVIIGLKLLQAFDENALITVEAEAYLNETITIYLNDHMQEVKIVGILFSDGPLGYMMYTTIHNAAHMLGYNLVNRMAISIDDPLDSLDITAKIDDYLKQEKSFSYTITDWQDGKAYAANALYVEKIILAIVQTLTAVSIALGISNMLGFMIKEKMNQIGILKAMGYQNKPLMMFFFLQTVIITCFGVLVGLFIGNGLSIAFTMIFRRGTSPLIAIENTLLNRFTWMTVLIIGVSNILFSFIPMRMVKKLKIIEVIKHD